MPVTAPKSYFGNLGQGSGMVELAVSLMAMSQGVVPPTLNYETPDPECPVNVVTEMQPTEKRGVREAEPQRDGAGGGGGDYGA